MTAEEFVRKIAETDPIEPGDGVNFCRFCRMSWATGDPAVALREWEQGIGKLWDRHDEDCLWVEALRIFRDGKQY